MEKVARTVEPFFWFTANSWGNRFEDIKTENKKAITEMELLCIFIIQPAWSIFSRIL